MENLRVKETMDSLYKAGKILPLVIIGVEAGDRMKEYGVTDKPDYLGRGAGPVFMMHSSMMNSILMPRKIQVSGNFSPLLLPVVPWADSLHLILRGTIRIKSVK